MRQRRLYEAEVELQEGLSLLEGAAGVSTSELASARAHLDELAELRKE